MNKDIVKNAVICLSHLEIEDTTYKIARDIVIEEYEQQKEEIKRLNNDIKILLKENENKEKVILKYDNIINGMEKFFKYAYDNEVKPLNDTKISVWTICLEKLQELKGDSSNDKSNN